MEDLKILHLADIHAKDDEINEVRKCLDFILETAKKERPDAAVIAGDSFDNQQVRLDSLAAKQVFNFVFHLAQICPVVIGIGTVSHDGQTVEVLSALENVYCSAAPLQLYYDEMQKKLYPDISYVTGSPRAVFSVLPAPAKKYFQGEAGIEDADKTIAAQMSAIFAGLGASAPAGVPHVLVGHWNTVGAMKSESQIMPGNDIEISVDQMMLANPDLVCLGHLHLSQFISPNIYYSGSIYRKDFGEMEDKGVYIHTLSESGLSSRFINTPTRKLWKCEINLTGEHGIESFPGRLEAEIQHQGRPDDCLVRCTIKCWADEADLLNIETIKKFFGDCGAKDSDVRRLRAPRAAVRGESVLTAHSLPDKLTSMATIRGEAIAPGHVAKAHLLETETPERIIAIITGSAPVESEAA